jgi:hypothetical protein
VSLRDRVYITFCNIGQKPSLLVILFTVCLAFWQIDLWRSYNSSKGESNFVWDVFGYYSYLPAMFLNDGQFQWSGDRQVFVEISPIGVHCSKYTYGMSILYAPFFAIGYLVAVSRGEIPDGFSEPFATSVRWGCIIYVIVGLIHLRNFLRFYFSEKITALTLFAVMFGTMLFLYTFMQSELTHAYLFALFSAFLYYTKKWHDAPRWPWLAGVALTGGLSVLIRPIEIYIFFFFLFWNVRSWKDFRDKARYLAGRWPQMFVMALIIVALWIPQFIYWKKYAGSYFYFSYGRERFFWLDPQIMNILFSYRKGWITYTPLVVLAFTGFFFVKKDFPIPRWPFIFVTALTIYVFSCWWAWDYGGGFGNRAFCQQIAYLSVPMAFFFRYMFADKRTFMLKGWCALLSAVFLFSCVWLNIGQSLQFHQALHKIHPYAMNKKVYWDVMRKYQFTEDYEYQFWGDISYPEHQKWLEGVNRDDRQK